VGLGVHALFLLGFMGFIDEQDFRNAKLLAVAVALAVTRLKKTNRVEDYCLFYSNLYNNR
jgi:hypothetical protein